MPEYGAPQGIHILLAKHVPHILERIFFSLDQESFDACREVCSSWNLLLESAPFQRRYDKMLVMKRELEEQLIDSSTFGDVDVVGRLLSLGVDKDCESDSGDGSGYEGGTPLYWAATNGHADVVRLLLDAGADLDKADVDGETPLYWASVKDHRDVVKMLLDAGADPDLANNKDEKTPLYQAAESGLEEVVKLLLHAGADPNKHDEEGITPIYKAVQNGHMEIAKLLIKGGALKEEHYQTNMILQEWLK